MRLLSIFIITLIIISACSQKDSSKLISENSDITIGQSVEKSLQKHSADTFKLNLAEEAFVTGYAEQKTVDVEVHILGPDKKEMNSYDDPARGPEYFFFSTKEAGIYYVVVKPYQENEGDYELHLSNAVTIPSDPSERVDQIAAAIIPPDGPGATIAVVQDGKTVYSKGFGYANLEYGIPNTPQTIFHIASISKQFTGFACAMLTDQGKISMDDDIRKYIPELHDFGTPITLNHLVHHTSGLRDQWNLLALAGWRLDDVITKDQILRLMSRQRELNFPPGEEFLYCNTGFTLLAEVVSRVTGQSFAEWTKENIFEPLEMNNTLFYDDHEKIVPNRAYSYYLSDTIYKKSVLSYANVGATSLFTTVEDLSKWAINFETMRVGNTHVMDLMGQPFILNNGDTIYYGFGQGMGIYKGLKNFSHGGADAGYRTMLLRFPEQHFSVSVFSNLANFSPGGLAFTIAETYLSDQFKVEPEEAEENEEEAAPPPAENIREEFDPKTMNIDDFEGRFYSEELQTFYDFEAAGDSLVAHHQRHDDIKLWPTDPDEFRSNAWWMGRVEFTRDPKSMVDGMKVSSGRVRNVNFRKVEF